jgi:hypothetical protein
MRVLSSVVAFFCVLFILPSCQKELAFGTSSADSTGTGGSTNTGGSPSNNGTYYFKAKFDGNPVDFSKAVIAAKTDFHTNTVSLTITGVSATESASISLWSEKDDFAKGKTYGEDALNGTTFNSFGYGSLTNTDPSMVWASVYILGVQPESFHCTITDITSSYIKGTFDAFIYQNTPAVSKKVVTEGSFYAKFQ